jgi:hypothetical protein
VAQASPTLVAAAVVLLVIHLLVALEEQVVALKVEMALEPLQTGQTGQQTQAVVAVVLVSIIHHLVVVALASSS